MHQIKISITRGRPAAPPNQKPRHNETLHKIIKWAAEFEKMIETPILKYLTIYEDKNGITKSAFTHTNEQQLFKRLGIKDTESIYDFLINKYGMKGLTLYYLLADIDMPF